MNVARPLMLILLVSSFFIFFAGIPADAVLSSKASSTVRGPLPDKVRDTVIIRFDYKQSAIYHQFTFDVLDSVIGILKKNSAASISIDGYAFKDEGSDTICYYLSLNRALFIQTYILGRGIDSSKITSVIGHGKTKPLYKGTDRDGFRINCRAEIVLAYPAPPKKVIVSDVDGDGIADADDKCPTEFGYPEKNGCPNRGFILVPFEPQQSNLFTSSYKVLDSVIDILAQNPALNIQIEGHAYKTEGIGAVCDGLAAERAMIVKNYFLSRRIDTSRIDTIRSLGSSRPLNAGNNPLEVQRNSRAEIYFTNH